MAIPRAKKRDRPTMGSPVHASPETPSSGDRDREEEEYARAVAYLRAFHSCTAAAALHATPLDAIREADRVDEALVRDFSRALSVADRPCSQQMSLVVRSETVRLRKTSASKCLQDLDDGGSSSANDGLRRSPPRCFAPTSPPSSSETDDEGYSLGRGDDDDAPVAKRQRSWLLGDSALPSP